MVHAGIQHRSEHARIWKRNIASSPKRNGARDRAVVRNTASGGSRVFDDSRRNRVRVRTRIFALAGTGDAPSRRRSARRAARGSGGNGLCLALGELDRASRRGARKAFSAIHVLWGAFFAFLAAQTGG